MRNKIYISLNYRRIYGLVLLLTCFYLGANAQNIQVKCSLDKGSILIGDQTKLHIIAHGPAKSMIGFPLLKDSIGKIKIVNGPKPDTTFDKTDPAGETITHDYLITAFDSGAYVIPELEFRTKTGVFKTGTVMLRVKSVPVDTTKTFYDIKQPFAVHYTFWDWLMDHWILVAIIFSIIMLVIAIIFYLKSRPKGIFIKNADTALTIDTIALNKLYELRDKKLWQQNEVKLHYSELADILQKYLEKRYTIQTQEQTTGEILAGLKDKIIPANEKTSLERILTLADLAKFAREKPLPAENEQTIKDAMEFIRQTRKELPV